MEFLCSRQFLSVSPSFSSISARGSTSLRRKNTKIFHLEYNLGSREERLAAKVLSVQTGGPELSLQDPCQKNEPDMLTPL